MAIEARLRAGRPAVHVNTARLREGVLTLNPLSLHLRDIPALAAALTAAWAD